MGFKGKKTLRRGCHERSKSNWGFNRKNVLATLEKEEEKQKR